jgi:hypothetical protein
MRRLLTIGVVLAAGLGAAADDARHKEPTAADLLGAGIAKASKQEQNVFLLFGSPG